MSKKMKLSEVKAEINSQLETAIAAINRIKQLSALVEKNTEKYGFSDVVSLTEAFKNITKPSYEILDVLGLALLNSNGHGHEDVTEITDEATKTTLYKRVRVLDNAELLKAGKTVYKSSGTKRVEIEIDYLKHKPKEKESA